MNEPIEGDRISARSLTIEVAPDDTGRPAQRVTGRPDDDSAGSGDPMVWRSGDPVTASMVP